jgi:death on curing protein
VTKHLSAARVWALHDEAMHRLGSDPAPLRDIGLLESAMMRPQTAEYYEEADLTRQAVILAIGISQNQAFVDGNKRTAYAALDTFLDINGHRYNGDPIELARQLEHVAERTVSLEDAAAKFEHWLRHQVS